MHESETGRSETTVVTSTNTTITSTKPLEPLSTDVESTDLSEPTVIRDSRVSTVPASSSDQFESETTVQRDFEHLELAMTEKPGTVNSSHIENKHRLMSSSYENIYEDTSFPTEEDDIVIPGADDIGDKFDTKHTDIHFAIRCDGKSSSYENLYAESKEASFIEEKDVDEKESIDIEEFLREKGEGEDEKDDHEGKLEEIEPCTFELPPILSYSQKDVLAAHQAALGDDPSSHTEQSQPIHFPVLSSPIDGTYESGLDQVGYEEQTQPTSDERDPMERSWSYDAEATTEFEPLTEDTAARQRHFSSPDEVLQHEDFEPLDTTAEDGGT